MMNHLRSRLFRAVAVVAFSVCGTGALAQSAAQLIGIVTDQQGRAVPGAVVMAQHLPTGTRAETTTGSDGRFLLTVLRAGGPYEVTVNMAGFAAQERRDVTAFGGESTTIQFELQLASEAESVTVTADSAFARDEKRSAPMIMDVVSADLVLADLATQVTGFSDTVPRQGDANYVFLGRGTLRTTKESIMTIPEPATLTLTALGFAGLIARVRRSRRAKD